MLGTVCRQTPDGILIPATRELFLGLRGANSEWLVLRAQAMRRWYRVFAPRELFQAYDVLDRPNHSCVASPPCDPNHPGSWRKKTSPQPHLGLYTPNRFVYWPCRCFGAPISSTGSSCPWALQLIASPPIRKRNLFRVAKYCRRSRDYFESACLVQRVARYKSR